MSYDPNSAEDAAEREAGRKMARGLNAGRDQLLGRITKGEADERRKAVGTSEAVEVTPDGVAITRNGNTTSYRMLGGGPLSIGGMHRALRGPNAPALTREMSMQTKRCRSDGGAFV